ncbi:VOC family protein [Thermodesulfobacteriota bacterium]
MRIEHIAIWATDLEKLKDFYITYFNASPNEKYINKEKNFESYFLSFESGARLELMKMPTIPDSKDDPYKQFKGFIHLAISVGTKDDVNSITDKLKRDGFEIIEEPKETGDGYYESTVLDPEGNRIEITA